MDPLSKSELVSTHVIRSLRREGNIQWVGSVQGVQSLQEICLFSLAKRDDFKRDLPSLLYDLGRGDPRLSTTRYSEALPMQMPTTFRILNYLECVWTLAGENRILNYKLKKEDAFGTHWQYGSRFGRLMGHGYYSVESYRDMELFGLNLFLPMTMGEEETMKHISLVLKSCLLKDLPAERGPSLTRARYRTCVVFFPDIYEGLVSCVTRSRWEHETGYTRNQTDWENLVREGLSQRAEWDKCLSSVALRDISRMGFERWRSLRPEGFNFCTRKNVSSTCRCAVCVLTKKLLN